MTENWDKSLWLCFIGKMCDNVFMNNSMGKGIMGINVFEIGLNVSPNFKQQVCY